MDPGRALATGAAARARRHQPLPPSDPEAVRLEICIVKACIAQAHASSTQGWKRRGDRPPSAPGPEGEAEARYPFTGSTDAGVENTALSGGGPLIAAPAGVHALTQKPAMMLAPSNGGAACCGAASHAADAAWSAVTPAGSRPGRWHGRWHRIMPWRRMTPACFQRLRASPLGVRQRRGDHRRSVQAKLAPARPSRARAATSPPWAQIHAGRSVSTRSRGPPRRDDQGRHDGTTHHAPCGFPKELRAAGKWSGQSALEGEPSGSGRRGGRQCATRDQAR